MNLKESMEMIDSLLSAPENKKIQEMLISNELTQYARHLKLGQWIRNNCKMWHEGVDQINMDIDELNTSLKSNYPINEHPDDVSAILLDIYVDWKNNKIG